MTDEYELATDALDLFTLPPVDSSQVHGKTQTYYPHATINDQGPYEIIIPNDSMEMVQLNSIRLHGSFSVLTAADANIAAADTVSVVNNTCQSLFKQIELSLNGVTINDLSSSTYPYKAYIENLYTFDKDIKDTTLRALEQFYNDPVQGTTTIEDMLKANTEVSGGFKDRKARILSGNKIYFIMLIHLDFLQSRKLLIPGVEMKFRFIRADDSFTIFAKTAGPKIKMHHLELVARKINCDPLVVAGIEKALSSTTAKYPIAHAKIKTYLLHTSTQSQNISQIYRGKLPRSFNMVMVKSKAYDGNHAENSFRFQHFTLNNFNVYINGEPVHAKAIQPDWTNEKCMEQYWWLQQNIGLHMGASNGITFEDFKDHAVMFAYDRTPDLCNSYTGHGGENGTLDISVAFKTALTENVIMIFYAVFDEIVTIDKDRNVLLVQ